MKTLRGRNFYSLWFCSPAILLYTIFLIVPTVIGFYFAFTNWSIFYIYGAEFNGLSNFKEMFQSDILGIAIKNTFYYAVLTVVFKNLIGLGLALLLDKGMRSVKFYRAAFFMPCILSSMIVCLIFSAIYHPQMGILNGFLNTIGLGSFTREWLGNASTAMTAICGVEIWQWSGFHMAIYIAALQGIPKEYYDAAMIDGAGPFKQLRFIKLPLITASFTINIALSVISGLRVFDKVYALTNGGPADSTQVFQTFIFKSFGQGQLGTASAYNLVFTIVVTVLGIGTIALFRKWEVDY